METYLKTVDNTQHDDRDTRERSCSCRNNNDQVCKLYQGHQHPSHQTEKGGETYIYNRRRQNHGTQQINEHEEPHRETAKPKQLWQKHQLAQIMHRRVNPPPSLREQHLPAFRCHRMRHRIWTKLGLVLWEMLHQQRRQESIFTQTEQVLLVQGVDVGFGVFLDDAVADDDRTTLVGRANSVEGETTGKTGDGAKERLEGFGEMV